MKEQDLKVGQVFKAVDENGYEWNNTFINIDKQYKNGNYKIIIATASIGQNRRNISSEELLYKIKNYNWILIFDGENLVK
jgi:hypothetical protein